MEDLRIFPQLRIQYYPMRSRNWVQALVIITVYLNSSNSNVSRTLCAIRKFRTWTTTWLGQFKTQHGAKMGLFLTVASWIFWMPCRYRTMEWYCMQTYIYIYMPTCANWNYEPHCTYRYLLDKYPKQHQLHCKGSAIEMEKWCDGHGMGWWVFSLL